MHQEQSYPLSFSTQKTQLERLCHTEHSRTAMTDQLVCNRDYAIVPDTTEFFVINISLEIKCIKPVIKTRII